VSSRRLEAERASQMQALKVSQRASQMCLNSQDQSRIIGKAAASNAGRAAAWG